MAVIEQNLKWIVDFSQTPTGIIFFRVGLVFLIAEFFGRQFAYKIMIFTDWSAKVEKALVDLSGYVINILAGIFMAYLFKNGLKENQIVIHALYYIFGSMAMHVAYVRYVDKWIKSKIKTKG